MRVASTFIVTQTGVGKPDYSKEVSLGRERSGLSLKYGQTLKSFFVIFTTAISPFAWVKGVLAPGVMGHLVDAETGVDLPYTLPAGYIISLIQDSFGFKEDSEVWIVIDTFPTALLSVSVSGLEIYRNRVSPFTTATLDPTGASSHEIDFQVTNRGEGNLEGSFAVSAIVEAVGTEPLPTIKTVKCKYCGHQWDVPNSTTNLICPECGKLTIVYDLSSFRGTP